MENSSNNKAVACFILYGAPLVILAKHGWQLGVVVCLLFLAIYFLAPSSKEIRSSIESMDKHVMVSYSAVISLFAMIDVFSTSHYWKALIIISLGLCSLYQLKKLQVYFTGKSKS